MKGSLTINNLYVSVEGKEILRGVSLCVAPGKVHAVMGPNGSGKSTLAYALMGHPSYQCQMSGAKCQIKIGNKDISTLPTEERARRGLFLALQSPIAIPGVTVMNLLRSAYEEIHGSDKRQKADGAIYNPVLSKTVRPASIDLVSFQKTVNNYAKLLHIDESFLSRGIHDGFSGGEKKKIEMLQALVLSPKFAIFDEIDTGLDVDALKTVASAMRILAKHGTGIIVITHYHRILKYLVPDVVHVLVNGKIVKTGGPALAKNIEEKGYKPYGAADH